MSIVIPKWVQQSQKIEHINENIMPLAHVDRDNAPLFLFLMIETQLSMWMDWCSQYPQLPGALLYYPLRATKASEIRIFVLFSFLQGFPYDYSCDQCSEISVLTKTPFTRPFSPVHF